MRAVGVISGAIPVSSVLPKRLRAATALACLAFVCSVTPAAAQSSVAWSFSDDAFSDLWFHGLAVVGYHGFGTAPLYDPEYALAARRDRAEAGLGATTLERQRATFLGAFQGDDAYEVFHFVPLYFAGAGREAAMRVLKEVASGARGLPETPGSPTYLGREVVSGLLREPHQRRILGLFVQALEEEWTTVVEPRRAKRAAEIGTTLARLRGAWVDEWAATLSPFLTREGLAGGAVHVAPGLGIEGRFLERDPSGRAPVVAVGLATAGADAAAPVDGALASLLRELCYPAVRRAFRSFEGRFEDRVAAARASDLAATRCGELLLERYLPAKTAAYRTRFRLPAQGMGSGFLSASGGTPGVAAWEGQLEKALLRELNFDSDEVRAAALPVGRNP